MATLLFNNKISNLGITSAEVFVLPKLEVSAVESLNVEIRIS